MYRLIFPFLFLVVCVAQATPFTSADLAHILKAKPEQKALIYSWSPHMNLSIRGLDEIIVFAKKNKIQLTVVLDPNCDLQEAQEIANLHHWPKDYLKSLQAEELIEKGFRVHYPAYLLSQNGHLVSPTIPGYKSSEELTRITRTYFK